MSRVTIVRLAWWDDANDQSSMLNPTSGKWFRPDYRNMPLASPNLCPYLWPWHLTFDTSTQILTHRRGKHSPSTQPPLLCYVCLWHPSFPLTLHILLFMCPLLPGSSLFLHLSWDEVLTSMAKSWKKSKDLFQTWRKEYNMNLNWLILSCAECGSAVAVSGRCNVKKVWFVIWWAQQNLLSIVEVELADDAHGARVHDNLTCGDGF